MLALVIWFPLPNMNKLVPPGCMVARPSSVEMLATSSETAPPATQLNEPLKAVQAAGIPLICAICVSDVVGHWIINETTQNLPLFTYRVSAFVANVSPAPLPSVAVQVVGAVTSLRSEVAGCDWCGTPDVSIDAIQLWESAAMLSI